MRQRLFRRAHLPASEYGALEDRVFHHRVGRQLVGVSIDRLAGHIGPEPVIQLRAGECPGEAAGKIVAQAEHMADFVRHDLADVILRGLQHGFVGQFVAGEHVLQAVRHLLRERLRVQLAARRRRQKRHA